MSSSAAIVCRGPRLGRSHSETASRSEPCSAVYSPRRYVFVSSRTETTLDDIGDALLGALEVDRRGGEDTDPCERRHEQRMPRRMRRADQRPAEALDYADHRIQRADRPPRLAPVRHDDHGREEEP